jgi:integrase
MNSKSVRKMSESESAKTSIGKADSRYWLQAGKLISDPRCRGALFCKIQVHGRRESFPLLTTNKSAAASKAAKIYADISVLGWDAAITKHKPEAKKALKPATVGALIEAASRLSSARRESLDAYAKALRRITSAVMGMDSGGKYDFKNGSRLWREKVDAVTLEDLTPARFLAWKNEVLKKAKKPEDRNHAAVTVNSLIRNSKALLSKKILPFISQEIPLPSQLWFHGITSETESSLRYKSKLDAAALIASARNELAESQAEAFKMLLLTLICGLRRSEADALQWSQIDFEKGTISVEDNEFRRLKSKDSAGVIGLDAELVDMLRGYHARSSGKFVLETPKLNRIAFTKRKSRGYRCGSTHRVLLDWLRANGVRGLRPIHTLRKEIGSIIACRDGIFKASRYLRHSDIRITSRLYADTKTPVSAGLGALLAIRPDNAAEVH